MAHPNGCPYGSMCVFDHSMDELIPPRKDVLSSKRGRRGRRGRQDNDEFVKKTLLIN
jgi:hypothetical protein